MGQEITKALLETIDRYIKGELSADQLSAFEEAMEKNPALKEEVSLQQQLFNTLDDKSTDWHLLEEDHEDKRQQELKQKLNNPEYQSLSKKIQHLGQEYVHKPPAKKKVLLNRFKRFIPAAAVILFLVVGGTMYLIKSNQSLDRYYYAHANWNTELPSFAEKGTAKNNFVKAEDLFKAEAYLEAIQLFVAIQQVDELYPYSLLYIGAAYANLNKDQQALDTFNKLTQMDAFAENSRGLWYATLIHLKQNDRDKALEVLNIILSDSNNYHYKEAKRLLEQLKH